MAGELPTAWFMLGQKQGMRQWETWCARAQALIHNNRESLGGGEKKNLVCALALQLPLKVLSLVICSESTLSLWESCF